MKKLSEIYKELGIAFTFPIEPTGLAESIEAYEARTFPIAMDKGSAKADTTQRAQLDALGDKIKDAGLDSADYTG